jgi:hypothetical protein
MHANHSRYVIGAALMTIAISLITPPSPAAAGGFGDFLKSLSSFDFGTTEFDPSKMDSNRLDWEDRERWVNEALTNAYKTLARSDTEVNLFDFQNYFNVLAIEWTREYLTDPANIGNLNAYATFVEYLSRYLKVKQNLIEAIAELTTNYAILNRVDPRQLTGPFQLGPEHQPKTVTERASGAVDATAANMALATSAGAVEKYTEDLTSAIEYGLKLEGYFRRAANIEAE